MTKAAILELGYLERAAADFAEQAWNAGVYNRVETAQVAIAYSQAISLKEIARQLMVMNTNQEKKNER